MTFDLSALTALLVALTGLIGALVGLAIQIVAYHRQVNARMDQLLSITAKAARAEGVASERDNATETPA